MPADRLTDAEIDELLGLSDLRPNLAPMTQVTPVALERRLDEATPGRILNPATGRLVKRDGAVGRRLEAAHQAALIASGQRLAVTGSLRGVRAHATAAGPATISLPRAATRASQATTRTRPDAAATRATRLKATGAWRAQAFEVLGGPVTTVEGFAATIARRAAATPNYRQAVVVYETPDGEDRIRRTVHGRTAGEIKRELLHLERGDPAHGSDVVPGGYTLQTGEFSTGSVVFPSGGAALTGVSKNKGTPHPHFKLVELAGKSAPGDCLFAVLRAVARGAGLPVPSARNNRLRSELGLPAGAVEARDDHIGAVAALFGLRVRVITGMAVPPDHEREFDDSAARLVGRNLCRTIAEPVVIAAGGSEDAPPCDVYLAAGHYEYIAKVLEPIRTCPVTGDILPGAQPYTRVEMQRRVLEQGRIWYGDRAEPGTPKNSKITHNHIIVYDYETTYGADGELEPYALGYLVFDPAAYTDGDFSGAAGSVVQCYRAPGGTRYSVTAPLLDTLASAPSDVQYTLVSFNGTRFDHFILAKAANHRGCLTGVFATSAGLRSVRIGRHSTLDVAKLIPGTSLAAACQSFRTNPSKVAGFSHTIPQKAFEAGRLSEWLAENKIAVCDYLEKDVLSCASLLMLVTGALRAVTGQESYGPKAVQTVGGHAWKKMTATCDIPAPVASHALDLAIRGVIVGGRTQVYRPGSTAAVTLSEPLRMVDFASLYPTAMKAVDKTAALFPADARWGWYPCGAENGEPVHVTELAPGDVGVYRVTVHAQPTPNVLPRRVEGEPLDWAFRGEFETWATHTDIALIRSRPEGRVTVHEGYRWLVCTLGLFEPYITALADKKDEQDRLKSAGAPEYNPALREVYKLLMNSASGKCCQANYDDVVTLATGSKAQLAAERKMDPGTPITWIPLGGETCIIMGKKLGAAVYRPSQAKPSILAVLIYSYSRALVWQTLCQHNVLYSDTDSGLFRVSDYEALRRAFPALDPEGRDKSLGDLEEELGEHEAAEAYLVAPKDYAIFTWTDAAKTRLTKKSKLRVKGVNQRSDRLIAPDAVESLTALTAHEYTDEYYTSLQTRSRPLADPETLRFFFQERAAGKRLHVLSGQITRSFKDEESPFSLRQRYLIKEL